MADLKTQNTSYPASLDTATVIADNTDTAVAAHVNGPASAIVAIETELGVTPKGTSASVAARLNTNIHSDGGLLRGSVFPSTPPNVPHYFYKTDETKLYIYNTGTASYDAVTTAVVLAAYVQKDVPTTITAIHTLNPASTSAPLIIGANGAGQKVIGLNADKADGYDFDQSVAVASSPSFVRVISTQTGTLSPLVVNSTTKVTSLNADLLDGQHADTAGNPNTIVSRDNNGDFGCNRVLGNLAGAATDASGTGTAVYGSANGLMIVRGAVRGTDATLLEGSGFSATRNSTGSYYLNFSPNFGSVATIVISSHGTPIGFLGAAWDGSHYTVATRNSALSVADTDFSFIAVGIK
jgi:hypothetical protein